MIRLYSFAVSFLLFISGFSQTSNLFPCKKEGYACFCDSSGKVVLNGKWRHVGKFKDGYAHVAGETRRGYIDTTGKYESNCHYEDISKFYKGYAWAADKRRIYIINSKCEVQFSKKVRGERSVAFFDSIMVVYTSGRRLNYGALDYNFKVVIPFIYSGILKSSSERYYFVATPTPRLADEESGWGVYDIITRQEVVPCIYKGGLSGQIDYDGAGTYRLDIDQGLLNEMKKYDITLPISDEISNRINGIYNH